MKNRLSLSAIVFVVLFFVMFSACRKEEVNNNDLGFAIQLTVEKPNRNTLLQWTEINVSDFVEYVIVRSIEPIPEDLAPSSGVITRIDDYKTTSFQDATVPFEKFIYYKVYAKIGDRFLSSPSVKIQNDIKLLALSTNNAVLDTDNNMAFLYDANQNTIFKYNYETNTIIDTLLSPINPVGQARMALGNHGEGNELYVAGDFSNTLKIYDADNLSFKTSISANGFIFSIVSGNNDFLYLYTDNWQQNTFSVYRRSTKQLTSGTTSAFGGNEGLLGLAGTDGFNVISVIFNVINLYSISSQGQIVNTQTAELNNNFFGNPLHIRASNDGEFFIPDITGTVMNKNLQIQGSLSGNQFFFFQDFVFSDNNDKIWGLNSNELIEFSFPSFEENMRIPLNYQVVNAIKDGNELIIAGVVFDPFFGTAKTIVDKIPL